MIKSVKKIFLWEKKSNFPLVISFFEMLAEWIPKNLVGEIFARWDQGEQGGSSEYTSLDSVNIRRFHECLISIQVPHASGNAVYPTLIRIREGDRIFWLITNMYFSATSISFHCYLQNSGRSSKISFTKIYSLTKSLTNLFFDFLVSFK